MYTKPYGTVKKLNKRQLPEKNDQKNALNNSFFKMQSSFRHKGNNAHKAVNMKRLYENDKKRALKFYFTQRKWEEIESV